VNRESTYRLATSTRAQMLVFNVGFRRVAMAVFLRGPPLYMAKFLAKSQPWRSKSAQDQGKTNIFRPINYASTPCFRCIAALTIDNCCRPQQIGQKTSGRRILRSNLRPKPSNPPPGCVLFFSGGDTPPPRWYLSAIFSHHPQFRIQAFALWLFFVPVQGRLRHLPAMHFLQ